MAAKLRNFTRLFLTTTHNPSIRIQQKGLLLPFYKPNFTSVSSTKRNDLFFKRYTTNQPEIPQPNPETIHGPQPLVSASGRIRGRLWDAEEDNRLKEAVKKYDTDWKKIAEAVGGGRSNRGCRLRWMLSLRSSVRRGSFTRDEIRELDSLQRKYPSQWTRIAMELGTNRTAAQVRENILNRFSGTAMNRKWTKEEDDCLKKAVNDIGIGHWTAIANRLGQRSDAQCYERWTFSLAPQLRGGAWSQDEDEQLVNVVDRLRESGQPFHFGDVSTLMEGSRHRKSCRARYMRLVKQGKAKALDC